MTADQERRRYAPDPSLAPAWIFDIDGTLAKMNGRGPFEWHRVGEDDPIEHVALVAADLSGNAEIVLVSGRDESCREQTEEWLERHDLSFYTDLLMRPANDYRKDSIVKEEIFWRDIAPRWRIHGVFDDRDQVVEMWRSLGLPCFQVAPGAF